MPAIRPSLALLNANPAVGAVAFHGQPIGELAQRQVQIALQGDGDLSQRQLVPQTRAAVDLLSGPNAPAFERVLRGLLSTVDGVEGVRAVAGISLATSHEGFGLNGTMTSIDLMPAHRREVLASMRPAVLGSVVARIAGQHDYTYRTYGAYAQNRSWIDLSADASRSLLAATDDGRVARGRTAAGLVGTLVHELQHAVKPARSSELVGPNGMKPINWLEEATADVLTWQKPVLHDAADRMGLPYRDYQQWTAMGSHRHPGYPTHRTVLTDILREAGANVRSREGIAQANELLQGGALERVPGRLADAIIEHRGLRRSTREQLRTRIRDIGAVPEGAAPNGEAHSASMQARAKELFAFIDAHARR